MKPPKLSYLLLLFSAYCLQSYADIFPKTDEANNHKQITGFRFNLTRKIGPQGMIYSPLEKDGRYTLKCNIEESNTNKKIKISVYFDGESSAQQVWGKNSKLVSAQINGNSVDVPILFQNLKPIKLSEKWIKEFKLDQATYANRKEFYVIDLDIDPLVKFKGDEAITGTCDMKSTE